MSFAPTALLVFTHQTTGMKYFGKTTRIHEMHYYRGSGVYWKKHLKKHGVNLDVDVLGFYFKEEACTKAALDFSKAHNIVESDEWANLIEENGMDGAGAGTSHPLYGKPSTQIGVKRPWVGKSGADNPMFGKPSAMKGKKNIGASLKLKGRPRPEGGGKPSKKVVRIEDGKIYNSIAEAARDAGGSRSGITKCCMGKEKYAHGHQWRYATEQRIELCLQ
jgi:hypothetical protein